MVNDFPDLENGGPRQSQSDVRAPANEDEYVALNRYISTAATGRRRSSTIGDNTDDNNHEKKKSRWKLWRKTGGDQDKTDGNLSFPDDWLQTDIHMGLKAQDIEPRRRKGGWNELSAERQNPFLQFLGYFRGPILYGKKSALYH